ncbi:hypothetical protein AC578_9625 [Pseudocercospora eumusae]|uniref:Uncharacterized protein n=1 Tax=Pseudocercospora eumusae TaxID=321146 RepID=A0A139H4L1_9PEZI|nr:hypothetical protein AC578_9625 [Pseudocercospora eumusae]
MPKTKRCGYEMGTMFPWRRPSDHAFHVRDDNPQGPVAYNFINPIKGAFGLKEFKQWSLFAFEN